MEVVRLLLEAGADKDRANHPAQWLVTVSDGLQEAVHAETIQFNMYHQTCVVIVVVRKLAYDFKKFDGSSMLSSDTSMAGSSSLLRTWHSQEPASRLICRC